MKARHSSKRKRGRPPLPANDREPNGKPSRRQYSIDNRNLENNMNVAVSTRIRHLGLVDTYDEKGKLIPASQLATDPKRGYVLGLMLLDETIDARQHSAGVSYARDMARFYGLTGIPFPSPRAHALATKSEGEDDKEARPRVMTPDERHEAAQAAEMRAGQLVKALRTDPMESFHKSQTYRSMQTKRAIEHAVNMVCLADEHSARMWPEHMHVFLRKGLNLLAEYYSTR